jgi:Carbohydrate family 9 binding domain-like
MHWVTEPHPCDYNRRVMHRPSRLAPILVPCLLLGSGCSLDRGGSASAEPPDAGSITPDAADDTSYDVADDWATVPEADAPSDDVSPPPSDAPQDVVATDTGTDATQLPDVIDGPITACWPDTTAPCDALPRLDFDPVIDGFRDDDCAAPLFASSDWVWIAGVDGKDTTTTARFAAARVPSGVWFFVEVNDEDVLPAANAAVYEADAVEVYVDTDGEFTNKHYDEPGTVQLVIAAPRTTDPSGSARVWRYIEMEDQGPHLMSSAGAFTTGNGYVIEMIVRPGDVGMPTPTFSNDKIGFNVAVDTCDADGLAEPCTSRTGQLLFHCPTNGAGNCSAHPADQTGAFCTPSLGWP